MIIVEPKRGYQRRIHDGYKKIHDGFESAGLPMPEVENFCGGVRVSFKRDNVNHGHQDVLGNIDLISASQLTERQRRIVERLVDTVQWNVLENVLEIVLETGAPGFFRGRSDGKAILED